MINRYLNKGRNQFALYCLSSPLLLIVVVLTCKSNYENTALSRDIGLLLGFCLSLPKGSLEVRGKSSTAFRGRDKYTLI